MRLGFRTLGSAVVLFVIGLGGLRVPLAAGPEAAMERVRITETRDGIPLWDVEADNAEVFEERGIAVLTRVVQPVRIVIYQSEERLTSYAHTVVVDLKTKDLELIGQVRSESSAGTRIFSERMRWSADKRHITTDLPVVVEKGGLHIRGRGMVADTVLGRMTIREQVSSEITLAERPERQR